MNTRSCFPWPHRFVTTLKLEDGRTRKRCVRCGRTVTRKRAISTFRPMFMAFVLVASVLFVAPGHAAECGEGETFGAKRPPSKHAFVTDNLSAGRKVSAAAKIETTDLVEKWEAWRDDFDNHISTCRSQEQAERLAAEQSESASIEVRGPTVSASAPVVSGGWSVDWEMIAACESGVKGVRGSADWHIDSTYDGGLQFHPQTWLGHGGGEFAPYAYLATPTQQMIVAERTLAAAGIGQWPICGAWG